MVFLPELMTVNTPLQKQIIDFRGYNVSPVIEDGEMRDMMNLSSSMYPNLSQRGPRGPYTTNAATGDGEGADIEMVYPDPEVMLVKNGALAVICKDNGDNPRFFYGYTKENGIYSPTPYPNVAITSNQEHKMVAINTRICIWPEKIFFNVKTGETGPLGVSFTHQASATGTIVFNNDTTSVCTVTVNQCTSSGAEAAAILKAGDAVDMRIYSYKEYLVSAILQDVSYDSSNNQAVFTFAGDTFLDLMGTNTTYVMNINGTLRITRYVPDLDFVMESNNRLWGCHDNAICCCKLGDPTNWHYYQGVSLDSYEVEVGTDGPWTGCVPYSSHLIFFKENYIHRVYGNTPNTYQTQQSECYGLEKGSEKSVCVINGTVFYKSKIGIMAYGGTLPEHISAHLGSKKYTNAIAGSDGAKYYVSMKTASGEREQLVFDLDRVLWHKEDDMRPLQYVYLTNDTYNPEGKNQLLYIKQADDGDMNRICSVTPYIPFEEEADGVDWMAELGPFDEYLENKKIYSKIRMRLKLDEGSEITVSVRFDNGEWQAIRHIYQSDERAAYIPIAPRRCDKFFIKLEGKGGCVVESLLREYRERSGR